MICELDIDDYFLAELDDPQEPVVLRSDDEFNDLEDINEDEQEGIIMITRTTV